MEMRKRSREDTDPHSKAQDLEIKRQAKQIRALRKEVAVLQAAAEGLRAVRRGEIVLSEIQLQFAHEEIDVQAARYTKMRARYTTLLRNRGVSPGEGSTSRSGSSD